MAKVVVNQCTSYELEPMIEQLNTAIAHLGGWNSFVSPGQTILLKINLIGPKPPESAAVTHCEFVRAITRILKGLGCTVWIGDSAGGAIAGLAPTARALKVAGFERVAEEEGAELKNFDREGVVEVLAPSVPEGKMYLAKPIFEADVVINLPKFKTHSSAIFTGAVKNVYGLIPGLRKAEYHRIAPDFTALGNVIADIHDATHIHLHIMDGIVGMEGEGPTGGTTYPVGKILMSTDPLALDSVAISMLGMDVTDVPILRAAKDRRLGTSDRGEIKLVGDYSVLPLLQNYKLPKRFRKSGYNHAMMVRAIEFMRTKPVVSIKKCKRCNACVESCPMKAINKDSMMINYDICIECMCCHEFCMYEAIELRRQNRLADVLMKVATRFTHYK